MPLRFDFSTKRLRVGQIRLDLRLNMVEDLPTNERTSETAETAVPLPDRQGRSYTPRESERGRAMTSVEAGRRAERRRVSSKPLAQADRLVVTMLAGLFVLLAGMFAAGAAAFTTLSGQLVGMQEQTRTQLLDMQKQIGKLSERMARIETALQVHHGPLPGP